MTAKTNIPPEFCSKFRRFMFSTKDNKQFGKIKDEDIGVLFKEFKIEPKRDVYHLEG